MGAMREGGVGGYIIPAFLPVDKAGCLLVSSGYRECHLLTASLKE